MGKLIAALMAAILGFVLVITSIGWLGSKLTHAVERQPTMPIVAVLAGGGRNDFPAFTTG
jgi:hypothetical protein